MRKYYKKKSIGKLLVVILSIAIVVGGAVYVLCRKGIEKEKIIEGQEPLEDVEIDAVAQPNIEISDDIRLHNFSYVELNNMISNGDYVDVRINFDDGSDYIVLSKKRVEGISVYDSALGTDNELWINVSEEEILRMSSAVYDCATKENCRLYAVKYISELQKEAYVTYPVNQIVAALIQSDPNIIDRATQMLDDNIRDQIDGLSNGNSHNQSSGASRDEEKDTNKGDGSPYMDDTPGNNEQSFGLDDDNSLVYDVEDDKEIQYLD